MSSLVTAFLVGGALCLIGQLVMDLTKPAITGTYSGRLYKYQTLLSGLGTHINRWWIWRVPVLLFPYPRFWSYSHPGNLAKGCGRKWPFGSYIPEV